MHRLLPFFCIALAMPPAARAQEPVRLERQGQSLVIVNSLAIPVAVLISTPVDSVTNRLSHAVIGARSSSNVALPSTVNIANIEPLTATIGLRYAAPVQCAAKPPEGFEQAIARLRADTDAPALEGSADATRVIEAATQLAQLHLARTQDSLDLERNSMTAFTARMLARRDASPMMLAQQRDKDRQETIEQMVQDIGYAALAYSEAAEAKYDVLRRDADRYRELLRHSEEARRVMEAHVQEMATTLSEHTAYSERIVTEIDAAASSRPNLAAFPVGATVQQLCDGPAGIGEPIAMHLVADVGAAAAIGDVTFDRGSPQRVILRRIRGTDEWRGAYQWPGTATTARLRVRAPGSNRWSSVAGSLSTERPSPSEMHTRLVRDVQALRKRLKEATFRADGADHLKTIVIP